MALDGKRLNFNIATMQTLLYGGNDFDFETGLRKDIAARLWKAAEASINLKRIRVYRNGNRNSVDLYGTVKFGTPILFGTGSNMDRDGHRDFAELFYNPTNYGIKKEDDKEENRRYFTPAWSKKQ